MKATLSVVIPAYNEEDNIATCLTSVSMVLKKLKLDAEIIVVNDGSKDRTGEIAKKFIKTISNLKIITNNPNKGYGGSLKAGFAAAKKDFIVFLPADNQFDFSQVSKLLDIQSETGADVVSGIRTRDQDPLPRRINRWLWNKLVYTLFGQLLTDIDCGFKLIRRNVLSKIKLDSNGALIDTQLLAGIRSREGKIAEVEVAHYPRQSGSPTGANPLVIFKALQEIFTYWWNLRQELLLEQGRNILRWEAIVFFCIILLASFMRLWRISGYMTFLGDEGRDVSVVRDMLLGRKFTLIGPGTSIGNMYLGPLYYYMMLLPLAVTNFSPVGPAIQIALLGVATVALLWWIGRQWFGRIPALFISILYSLSPTVITYSHSSWNPNIMPFFALLAIYGIWKVWRLGYWRWLVITAVSFAFILNSHYLGLLLFPTLGLFWFLARPARRQARRYSLYAVILFLFLMSPLFFFDMRHNWLNFRAIAAFFTDRQTTVNLKAYKALPKVWPIWQDINTSLLAGKNPAVGTVSAVFFALAFIYLAKNKPSREFWLTTTWLGVGLVGLGLYKQHVYDHYYGFLFPAPFLLLGFVTEKIKYWSIPLLLLLFTFTVANSPLRYPPNNQLAHTREIVEFINNQAAGQPFNLALLAKRNYDKGYVYFLDIAKAPYYTINQQLSEQLFVICEDPVCEPINNPLWEVAAFGWAKVDRQWEFPWGTKLFRLVHNPSGK